MSRPPALCFPDGERKRFGLDLGLGVLGPAWSCRGRECRMVRKSPQPQPDLTCLYSKRPPPAKTAALEAEERLVSQMPGLRRAVVSHHGGLRRTTSLRLQSADLSPCSLDPMHDIMFQSQYAILTRTFRKTNERDSEAEFPDYLGVRRP